MPLFIIPIMAALGGLFVGSQVDNAVQSSASRPAIIDQSKMPWYVMVALAAVAAFILFKVFKKYLK